MNIIFAAISIIGSIASIFGAVWAWRQSISATSAAEEAKRIKDQVFTLTDISDLSEVKAIYDASQKTVRKYACRGEKDIAGVDGTQAQQDVEAIYKLMEKLNGMKHLLPEGSVEEVSKSLEDPLQGLVSASSPAEMKKYGKEIYDHLQPLLPLVRREILKKQNDVGTA